MLYSDTTLNDRASRYETSERGSKMFDIYSELKNSIGALTGALRTSIANTDNFNTPGFKAVWVNFSSSYSKSWAAGTKTVNPMTLAGSVSISALTTDFRQGNLGFGTELDCAIVGNGFFILSGSSKDSDIGGEKLYTRNGKFQIEPNGRYLTDSYGRKVFGFPTNALGNVSSQTLQPILVEGQTDIGFTEGGVLVSNFQKNKDDIKNGVVPPTAVVPIYRLGMTSFINRQGLTSAQGGAYRASVAAGEALETNISGTVYGDIVAEKLESSNVDVAKVALDMALLNRGFSAIQGVVDDVNKIMSALISKLSG